MKVEQHGEFRTAVFERTVTKDDVAEVVAADVEGAALLGNDPRMDVQRSIDVLAGGPPLRSLSVAWVKAVPTVPVAILRSVEHLSLAGRVGRTRLRTEAMPRLRSLDTPAALIEGPLAACASLEAVALDRFAAPDLGILDGCQALRLAKINGRRTELTFGWDTPPSHLQKLHIFSLFPTSLGGLEQLQELRMLELWANTPPAAPHDLDLRVLAGCQKLDYLVCANVGRTINYSAIEHRDWRRFQHA